MKDLSNSLRLLKKISNKKNSKYVQQIISNLINIQSRLNKFNENLGHQSNNVIVENQVYNIDHSNVVVESHIFNPDEDESDTEEVEVEVIEMDDIEKIDINVSKFKTLSIDEKTNYIKKVMSKYPTYFSNILQITENEFEYWGFKFDKNLLIITYKDDNNIIITRSIELSIFCKILRNEKLSKFEEKHIFTIPSMFDDEKIILKNETDRHKKKLLSNLII